MVSEPAPRGENGKTYWMFDYLLGYCYGKCVQIIGLEAPGNYLDQRWSNKILVRDQNLNISMISGFVSPGEPLFMDLNIPKYFKIYKKLWTHFRRILFS